MSGNDINTNMSVGPTGAVNSTLDGSFAGAGIPQPITEEQSKSWYEAMAKAWGNALDKQASVITDLSSKVSEGGQDQPSSMVQLTAQSLRMQFLSQNESTSTNAVGQALQTMGRKE